MPSTRGGLFTELSHLLYLRMGIWPINRDETANVVPTTLGCRWLGRTWAMWSSYDLSWVLLLAPFDGGPQPLAPLDDQPGNQAREMDGTAHRTGGEANGERGY